MQQDWLPGEGCSRLRMSSVDAALTSAWTNEPVRTFAPLVAFFGSLARVAVGFRGKPKLRNARLGRMLMPS